ncbi:MAG TPA: hypothetical protein VHZ33_10075 [Trebonia sp.]|jgi:hypothetical protein|nr:hypothetical protein [Trebonia sp.]
MTLLVDPPPPRDRGGQRQSTQRSATDQLDGTNVDLAHADGVQVADDSQAVSGQVDAVQPDTAPAPRLAEPPIPGGRVEAAMGVVIRVLSQSRLARPLPAVILSALGLGGVAFVGLCATAPAASVATPPVLLPLTSVARDLGAPHLADLAADVIMYVAIGLCCLGLAMMLWANSRGWSPNPRRVFAVAAAAVAVLVNITPVGSSDAASYAAYGRIAALGHNPYTFLPNQLPGGAGANPTNPYTILVSPYWRETPSVYGPVATWTQQLAAEIGGSRAWLTLWILMIMMGAAFVLTGYILLRTAANPVRAVLLWVANPLIIVELVIGGHLDSLLALFAIAAIVLSRRCTKAWHDVAVALLVGVAGGIKVNAILVALGIAIPLLHDRDWTRLIRIGLIAGLTTFGLYYFSYGLSALRTLGHASGMVISPTVWRGLQEIVTLATANSPHATQVHAASVLNTLIGFAWPPLMLALAWYLYKRLSPDVPTVVAASCALTFAWIVVAPWSLPWYSSIAWVTVALLPRNTLTRWLTLATGALSLLHFNGGHPTNIQIGPTP